jgi:methylenetetrahydrofolate dehydrogenase (NADP+)/methenyltetrahydrofolate cyclohydrolase
MKILDGKKLSERILKNLAKEIKRKRLKLKLAAVLVGNNFSSQVYIRKKEEACGKIGVGFELFKFSLRISKPEFKKEIKKIARRTDIKGMIIQLPLPKNFDSQEFLNLVPPEKDIDVLTETNIGKFYSGNLSVLPPTVAGIKYLLRAYKVAIKGKNVVLVGAGKLVGQPLALWLLKKKASFSALNELTKDISFFTKKADIIISGTGVANIIKGDMVKKGAVVIDAGVSRKGKKLVGDVDFKNVSKKASYITPVPGGVGPLAVACLLENLVKIEGRK